MKKFLFIFIFLICASATFAQVLQGKLTDVYGNPVPGVNVYLKNGKSGTVTNTDGSYNIVLKPGNQTIIFRMIGFTTLEKNIQATGKKKIQFDTTLKEALTTLNETVVVSDTRDLGKSIMQKVRDNRRDYLESVKNYQVNTYRRISLEYNELKYMRDSSEMKKAGDSITQKREKRKEKRIEKRNIRKHRNTSDSLSKKPLDTVRVVTTRELNESFATVFYDKPGRYKENISAENEYKIKWPHESYYISIGDNSDNLSVSSFQYSYDDPYLMVNTPQTTDFNFYRTEIQVQSLTEKPLQSPLAPASSLNYVFDYDYMYFDKGKKLYRIRVKPVFPGDALYSGFIVVEDSTWALHSVDLSVNPGALLFCKEFKIHQEYDNSNPGISVPKEAEFSYVIKEGKKIINGKTHLLHSNYLVNEEIPSRTFSTEVKEYAKDALEKDSAWWANNRPYDLSENEKKYSRRIDSLSIYYNSDTYKFKSDSSFNRIDLWSFLWKGIHVRSHKYENMFFITPLAAQINPMGIGGYRHRINGGYSQRFKNGLLLETEGMADYGVQNKDPRGKVGVGLTYIPKKFIRTFIRFGDYYDAINDNASITSVFSRSNFARTQMASISQRMEVVNGLFAELT
ncbi:MAG: DUF5686 family protein, partial [Bacteroidota bacterium]